MSNARTDVGFVTFDELRADGPETAGEMADLLIAEVHSGVRHFDGFISARVHLSLDGTCVVTRIEWAGEQHYRSFQDSLEAGPSDNLLRTLGGRPGVLSATSFAGIPAPSIAGPGEGRAPGIMSFAKRHVEGHSSAQALSGLLQESGDWKWLHPGFISASPYISLDGTTYVNYPQWESEQSFRAYMADPRNAAGQDAIAVLETAPPEFVMCTLVAHIEAADGPGEQGGNDGKGGKGSTRGTFSTGSLTRDQVSPLDQVQLFEKKYDPTTTDIIERLPIGPTWRCLELGAGAGSMAYWLAGQAHQGTVLAVDADAGYLDATRAPNLTVRQADITKEEFAPGSFDLILARAVFEHIPDPDEVLDRAMRWLAPGGWLVMEDFYYLPGADSPTAVGRSLLAAYVKHMESDGADMRWGRRLPATLSRAGLTSVDVRVTPAGPGQSAIDDELIGLRLRQEGHTLVDNGQVTADELAEFLELLGQPHGRDMTTLLVSAWGRRPVA